MKALRFQLILLALSAFSTVSAQHLLDSIPFKYENGRPVIDAKIEGKTYKFLFDTGDPLTRIFPEVPGWKIPKPTGKQSSHESIKHTEIQIGTYAQQVDIYPFKETQTCAEELTGVIGYNFMKDKIWMIDYRQKKIYRLDSPPPANKALYVIPIFIMPSNGLWKELLAEIKINGQPYVVSSKGRDRSPLLKFDTGFGSMSGTVGLLLNKRFLVEECNAPDISSSIEICGKQYQNLKPVTVELTLNNSLTFSVVASGREEVGQALLGNAFFDHFKPVFDLKNNQILLLSNE